MFLKSKVPAMPAINVRYILTSKAQHEGRVRAIVNMYLTLIAGIAGTLLFKNKQLLPPKHALCPIIIAASIS